ncbi:ABC transporter permease [Prolixibacter denitrificans]|uniref:ABC transporter permease n=1 Tax=Prolixibacter denitrificans TaxID=1541063 RepID=A0A2P8C988_9BACT|nr:ABC transporter permease [Prolixibacter denitrificans]PSK81526.1 putative ABC transport system permease protein [Prolixibacter denitrificans]GET21007.1 ABC transporter permease [Prolixibacter denitrificans]
MLLLKLILESFRFAYNALIVNKLRTFLSLLGITIGIFCIISVLTVIDSLERAIRNSMESLGTNVIYIQKWPWAPPEGETEYPWWKYMNRPVPKLQEAEDIMRRSQLTREASFNVFYRRTVQVGKSRAENVEIVGTSPGLIHIWSLDVARGRSFSEIEMNSARNLGMLGADVASQLFPNEDPVGKTIKIQGYKIYIIGVFTKMGEDMFGTSMDKRVLIPIKFAARLVDIRSDMGQSIIVKGKDGVSAQRLHDDLEGVMRSIRRLKPSEENDFALNEVSLISGQLDNFFRIFNLAGWIIGGFAILVGGFGIANIMFVSVRERTKIIGIQKSLGAKNYFIMLEFLFESVVLSVMGGLIGLLIVYGGAVFVSLVSSFQISLTLGNILTGIFISATIGVVAGMLPARKASGLDPVEAINTV